MLTLRTILCPTDFSEPAENALRYALGLAERFEARVILLHVDSLPTYGLPEGSVLDEPLRKEMRRNLEALARRYSAHGVQLDTELRRGVPYEAIVERARDEGVDLVVMGTHGRTGLPHLLLGSVAERVLRLSPVPVVTVRPETSVPTDGPGPEGA